jgi:hypothetical protein
MKPWSAALLILPGSLAAQIGGVPAIPTINPGGIVRSDTTRPGILPPGIVFSIWGHGYGPKSSCKGPALEVCGVQVLLDDRPIEVEYTNDVLINARMPEDAPSQPTSRLVVSSGGRHSASVDVLRAPERAVISLDGEAHVDGPVWIHVELPGSRDVGYPPMATPWDFACDSFEVRKNGKMMTPIPHRPRGMAYSGPSCPRGLPVSDPHASSRLPLHLQYRFDQPGDYEVRLSHYSDFGRRADGLRDQSDWMPITVLPAVPRAAITTRPQEPAELVAEFLPNLLASRDEQALQILIEYCYHASPRVRSYAADAMDYWPDAVAEPHLLEALRSNGPSPVIVQRLKSSTIDLANAAQKYLFSDDPLLFQGAIVAAGIVLGKDSPISPELRSFVGQRLIAAATGNIHRADGQTTNDLISLLGAVHPDRTRDVLWQLADSHVGAEQALIAIAWQKNPEDLPRIAAYVVAAPNEAPTGASYSSIPYAMHNNFGDASLPWLREVLDKAQVPQIRHTCAEELMRAGDAAGFRFALDEMGQNTARKLQIRSNLIQIFPDIRDDTDAQLEEFLRVRAQ